MPMFGWPFGRKKAAMLDPLEHVTTASTSQQPQDTRRYLNNSEYQLPKDQEEDDRLNFQRAPREV